MEKTATVPAASEGRSSRRAAWSRRASLVRQNRWIYWMMLPGLLFFLVFRYIPMYGIVIAFKEINPFGGPKEIFWGGQWVGLQYLRQLFSGHYFLPVLRNTVSISLKNLVFGFPSPILFALLLNEARAVAFKRTVQTISYMPHFLSWIVIYSFVNAFLNPTNGLVNLILKRAGRETVNFLSEPSLFQGIIVGTTVWHSVGWGAILYLAAMASIDPNLYEAARIDGASRIQEIRHITLPGIAGVILIVFILRIGNILDVGFEQILAFYSPPVYATGDIIDTYVYREGLINLNYSYAAAAGVFKSVTALILVGLANLLAKRWGHTGIW
jgi:putative aldouronate transport system permease protein